MLNLNILGVQTHTELVTEVKFMSFNVWVELGRINLGSIYFKPFLVEV